MESLEATRLSLEPKQRGSEQGIEAVRRKRPDTGRICREWPRFTTLWEVLTEDERADLLGSIVQVVEMTEKESVALELLPMPHSLISYSNRFELKSRMGAGDDISSIHPSTLKFRFKAFQGGKSRTKIPRPYRRTREAV